MSAALRDAADSMAHAAMIAAQERAPLVRIDGFAAADARWEYERYIITTAARLESLLGCMDRMGTA